MKTVGEFDQDHPHIVAEGQKHPFEILCLPLALFVLSKRYRSVVACQNLVDILKALHQLGDLVAEAQADIVKSIVQVAGDVHQKGGADRLVAQANLLENYTGHVDRA